MVFLGIKEDDYGSDFHPDYTNEPLVQIPSTIPTAPPVAGTQSVTVLGGTAPTRPIAGFRDPVTPPSGVTVTTSAPVRPQIVSERTDLILDVPEIYGDCKRICDALKRRQAVLFNTVYLDETVKNKLNSFVFGYVYSIDGRIIPVAPGVILAEPNRHTNTAPEAIERYRRTNFLPER